MIKLISFIVLTHFFQFNQIKILKATQVTYFFKLNQQYFFYSVSNHNIFLFCQINLNNLFSSDNRILSFRWLNHSPSLYYLTFSSSI